MAPTVVEDADLLVVDAIAPGADRDLDVQRPEFDEGGQELRAYALLPDPTADASISREMARSTSLVALNVSGGDGVCVLFGDWMGSR
jgi:hypothetical protein